MSRITFRTVSSESDILGVSRLAHEIWREHYRALLTPDKLEYMLQKMLTPGPIAEQIAQGYVYSFVCRTGRPIGFIAYRLNDPAPRMFVSKIYLLREERGKGYFHQILHHLAETARKARQECLWLTVARTNPSRQAYLACGFRIISEQDADIGSGYKMCDYVMEYAV